MYTAFATVYDKLMADVNYKEWAKFYQSILSLYGIRTGKVCECACGTGGITIPLAQLGYQMTGVDLSEEMLFEASQKARRSGVMMPFVKQDMRTLRLHRKMDAVICTCDGINYLPSQEDVISFFQVAWDTLNDGGCIIFDVSTPYKLKHILGNSFIGDESADIAYLWKNVYHPENNSVKMNLSIFTRNKGEEYIRISEKQTQYAYEAETLFKLLTDVGFTDLRFFGDGTFATPKQNERRWHISARKQPVKKEEAN